MIISRPMNRHAGFICRPEPPDGLPFHELGEIWAPCEWRIDSHANPGFELYCQIKGSSRWRLGGNTYEVPEGACYLIREGVRHQLADFSGGQVHFFFVVFGRGVVPGALARHPVWERDISVFAADGGLRRAFQGLLDEVATPWEWQAEACRRLLELLALAVARANGKEQRKTSSLHMHPAAARALELMRARPGHPWKLPELARMAGVSVPHLCEVFKAEFAESPMRHLQRLRVGEASRQLTDSDRRITDIAHDLGFASGQHFARVFREQIATSPRDFRRKK